MDAKWNTIRNKWKHQKISIIQTKNTTNKYSRPNKTKSRPQINQERYMGWEMDYRNAIHPYKLLFKRINMVICSLVHGRKSSLCIVMNHTFAGAAGEVFTPADPPARGFCALEIPHWDRRFLKSGSRGVYTRDQSLEDACFYYEAIFTLSMQLCRTIFMQSCNRSNFW